MHGGLGQGGILRGKLPDGEGHATEQGAGISGRPGHALLVGDDKFRGRYQVLSRAHHPHQGEDAQRHGQNAAGAGRSAARDGTAVGRGAAVVAIAATTVAVTGQRAGQARRNGSGDVSRPPVNDAGRVAGLQHPAAQGDGVYHLHHGGGYGALLVAGLRFGTEAGTVTATAEDADIALSAVQHHLLFQHGDAVELLGTVPMDAGLKDELDKETDGDGVETPVELYRVNADVGPGDAAILYPYLVGGLDQILAHIGQEHTHILKAIPVTAGVQDAGCLDTDRLPGPLLATAIAGIGRTAGKSVFRHMSYLLTMKSRAYDRPIPIICEDDRI